MAIDGMIWLWEVKFNKAEIFWRANQDKYPKGLIISKEAGEQGDYRMKEKKARDGNKFNSAGDIERSRKIIKIYSWVSD